MAEVEEKAGPADGIRILQQGDKVHVIWAGKLAGEFDHKGALQLAQAIYSVAKKAEEWAEAERIAFDQAMMIRSGAPVGLTSNPVIQHEAGKEAAHNRELRRYMPGIKSQEQVGTPAIYNPGPSNKRTRYDS